MSKHNRDRRQARAKLWHLAAASPAPIVYLAGDAETARRIAPPDVLNKMTFGECCGCQTSVILHPVAHRNAATLARRTGRELAIVCGGCSEELAAEPFAVLCHHDAALQSRLNQWRAEMD